MKKITVLNIPIFFIIPWVGYLLSLLNIKSKISAFVYISFAAFFGYAISFTDTSADSYRYAIAFMQFDKSIDYSAIMQMYRNGELRDPYRLLLFYFTSLFSDSPKVLYAFAGVIYGSISYLNLRIYVNERGSQTDRYTLILALLFITFCSLTNINGFKFWTGAMVAFYATYKFIILNKKIWIIGIFIAPLMHYSFVLFIPIIIMLKLIIPFTYNSIRVKPIVFYLFVFTFIASWFLDTNLIDISFIGRSGILPGEIGNRLAYVNSENVSDIVEKRSESSLFLTVNTYFDNLIKVYVFIVILYINKFLKRLPGNAAYINRIFSFVLLFYSFCFIATSFPSGGRFMILAHMFLVIFLCRFHRLYNNYKIRVIILLSILPFSFKISFINVLLPILILTPSFWYAGMPGVLLESFRFIN